MMEIQMRQTAIEVIVIMTIMVQISRVVLSRNGRSAGHRRGLVSLLLLNRAIVLTPIPRRAYLRR